MAMDMEALHPWKVTPAEAREIQNHLRSRVRIEVPEGLTIRTVGGMDASYATSGGKVFAGVVVMRYPELDVLEAVVTHRWTEFPYVPGLLSFREAPALLDAFTQLETKPDLLLVDGQGIAHPRRFGLAAHVGVLLEIPTVGCAKKRLVGEHAIVGERAGDMADIVDSGRVIGCVLRTRGGVKPVFVSPGHLCDVTLAVRMVGSTTRGFRLPEPIRQAHILVNRARANAQEGDV
jgi:deoxyribonuclease V